MKSTMLYSYRVKKKTTHGKISSFRYSYARASDYIWDWSLLQTISMKTVDGTFTSPSVYNNSIAGVIQHQNSKNTNHHSEFYFWRSLMTNYSWFFGSAKKRTFNHIRPTSLINFRSIKAQYGTNFYDYWLLTLLNSSLFSLRKLRGAGLTISNTTLFESWASAAVNKLPASYYYGTLTSLLWVGDFLVFLPVNLPPLLRSYSGTHYPFFLVQSLRNSIVRRRIGRLFTEFFRWTNSIWVLENRASFSEMSYSFFVPNSVVRNVKRVTLTHTLVAQQQFRLASRFTFLEPFAALKAAEVDEELDLGEFLVDADFYEYTSERNDVVLFWEIFFGVLDINARDRLYLKFFNWVRLDKGRVLLGFFTLAAKKILLKIHSVCITGNQNTGLAALVLSNKTLQPPLNDFNYINSVRPLMLLSYVFRICAVDWFARLFIVYYFFKQTISVNVTRYICTKSLSVNVHFGFYLFTISRNWYLFFGILIQKLVNFMPIFRIINYAALFLWKSVRQFLIEKPVIGVDKVLKYVGAGFYHVLRVFSVFTLFLLLAPFAALFVLCLLSLEFTRHLLMLNGALSVSTLVERPFDSVIKLFRGFNDLFSRLRWFSVRILITGGANVYAWYAGFAVGWVNWFSILDIWFKIRRGTRVAKFRREIHGLWTAFLPYTYKQFIGCLPLADGNFILRNISVSALVTVRESVWVYLLGVLYLFGSFGWWAGSYKIQYSLVHLRSRYLRKLTQSSVAPHFYIRGSSTLVGLAKFIAFFFFEIFVIRGWVPASVYLAFSSNLLKLRVRPANLASHNFDFSTENFLTRVFVSRSLIQIGLIKFSGASPSNFAWYSVYLKLLFFVVYCCKFVSFCSALVVRCCFRYFVSFCQWVLIVFALFFFLQFVFLVSFVGFYVFVKIIVLCALSCLALQWVFHSL